MYLLISENNFKLVFSINLWKNYIYKYLMNLFMKWIKVKIWKCSNPHE